MVDLVAKLVANNDRAGHQLWQLLDGDTVAGHIRWGGESYEFTPMLTVRLSAEQLARLAGFVRELDTNTRTVLQAVGGDNGDD